jgi:hypothetical protein
MATPNTRQSLKEYCLRKLGFPVVEINVDEDQVEDRIDDALQTYAEFHYDATQHDYLAIKITADQLANSQNVSSNTYGWIPLPDGVIGVTQVFPITSQAMTSQGADFNIFDLTYQLRLNELYEFTSSSYQYYYIVRQHIRMLELILMGQNPIRFNKHMNRLYIDMRWKSEVPADRYIIVQCQRVLQPDEFPKVYNDKWLKEYSTQLIKKQWGENLKKYGNYTLPGGMVINGQTIYEEATADILRLEDQLRDTWEEPPVFLVG